MTQLLTDLVYFVTELEASGGDVLSLQVLVPNRERQKLMREQNILKEVRSGIISLYLVFIKLKYEYQM